MPIEIKELVIRAIVDSKSDRDGAPAAHKDVDRDAIVQACVDETLRILRTERGR
jgi:hypothetical protein